MAKLLIVEDDPVLLRNVIEWLTAERYVVDSLEEGTNALERMRFYEYDAIVLDWNLPGMSGIDICKRYRQDGGKVPILMLTGKQEIDDKTTGLDSGADDYLTKPFHLKELSARLRALLRRPVAAFAGTVLTCAHVNLDTSTHTVQKGGKKIHLLPREYSLLEFFMKHQGQVFSADSLLDRVWHSDSEVSPESIRTYITRLRAKLDLDDGSKSLIETVHGFGYKMSAPD